jgi:hypothetical protein
MRHASGRFSWFAAGALVCAGWGCAESCAAVSNAVLLAAVPRFDAGVRPGVALPPVQPGPTGHKLRDRDRLLLDDFEGPEAENTLGGKANIFVQNPSRIMISRDRMLQGTGRSWAAVLSYDRKKEGGPYNSGGWCGYYSLLKQMKNTREDVYFDATTFNFITFSVRGENGDESFVVGLADRHWDKVGDSLKSPVIGQYLKAGRITKDWQEARIPLDTFFLDRGKLSAITIAFESSCFPDGSGTGTVYLDNIALEK